jgi:hypothetical protein
MADSIELKHSAELSTGDPALNSKLTPSLEDYRSLAQLQISARSNQQVDVIQITPLNYGSESTCNSHPRSYINAIQVQRQSYANGHINQHSQVNEVHVQAQVNAGRQTNQHSHVNEVHVQAQSNAGRHGSQHSYVNEAHVQHPHYASQRGKQR